MMGSEGSMGVGWGVAKVTAAEDRPIKQGIDAVVHASLHAAGKNWENNHPDIPCGLQSYA